MILEITRKSRSNDDTQLQPIIRIVHGKSSQTVSACDKLDPSSEKNLIAMDN